MAKVKIEVEVEVAGPANPDSEDKVEFVSIKCEGQQTCMLPKDVPAPRRLAKDLARAAFYKLNPAKAPKPEPEPEPDAPAPGQ